EKLAKELYIMIKKMGIDLLSVLSTDKYDNGLDGYSSIIRHEYKNELISNFKNTFAELTASGGMHILFKKRDDINYTQKIGVMPGVDIKANDNNFVKIFPSDGREVLQAVKTLPYYDGKFE
ncbi:bifunctional DNA primase/polymerase, partial [Streptococcus agalactiae]